ncbi:MAG: hypothetical protein ACI4C1_06715 [Lachnospiraceae bacterium]
MVEKLFLLSKISLGLSIAFAVLTVTLGIYFHVWNIIGDLSGRNARKKIAQMRVKKENIEKNKMFYPNLVNVKQEKLGENEDKHAKIQKTMIMSETMGMDSEETMAIYSLQWKVLDDIILVHTEESIDLYGLLEPVKQAGVFQLMK